MIPEGYEAIRENLSETEVLKLTNANMQVQMAEKDLQLANVAQQNAFANMGATGNCVIVKDADGAMHLVQEKKAEAPEVVDATD